MLERKLSKGRYVQTLVITISIFMLGVFIGFFISEKMISKMLSSYDEIRLKVAGATLETSILEGELCRYDILGVTGKERFDLGKQVEEMENVRGKTDEQVLRLKEEYTMLSVNHLLLVEKWKKECNRNVSIIIFFYSNKENFTESENQGFVLDYIYTKYPNKISTYAFDVDIDNPVINAMKRKYDVNVIPTVIINDRVYLGFQSKEKIESLI